MGSLSLLLDRTTAYSKTCVKRSLPKRPKIGFHDQLLLIADQKHCRMLQGENSAILSTFIKLPFVIKILVLFIYEWLFYTGLLYIKIHMSQHMRFWYLSHCQTAKTHKLARAFTADIH